MESPFHLHYPDQEDSELIELAVRGDKRALQAIIQRHQIFVYNLALKMSRNRDDAHDLTQEVFIKAITSLAKFKGKSSFRTWLYKITVNHFLDCKKRKTEIFVNDFEAYFSTIDRMPDHELNGAEEAELKDSIEELRISCTAGMLMCLDREQRLTYILGEMFKVDHNLGAAILGTTPGNFRVRLSRARSDLYSWMNKRCSLVNAANPCKCAKKTRSYIASGAVNPDNLQFNIDYTKKMHDLAEHQAMAFENAVDDLNAKVFLSHPLQIPKAIVIDEIFSNDLLKEMLRR